MIGLKKVFFTLAISFASFAVLYANGKEVDPSVENSAASQKQMEISSLVKLQILLDRSGFSSGEIDGSAGSNVRKAISAFQDANGLPPAGRSDEATLEALSAAELTEPLVSYTISDKDAAGPFNEKIPTDLMEQAELTHPSFSPNHGP